MTTRASLRRDARKKRHIRRLTAITILTLVLVSAGGAAFAHFRGVGAGSAAASTGSASTSLTLAPGAASNDLYPGGAGTVTTVVTNPGDALVRLPSLQLDTAQGNSGFTVGDGISSCPVSAFSFATQTNGGAGWTVPARGSVSITLPASVTLAASAPNGCQGAAVVVYLKAGS
ncbi:hypothetical protein [Microbacterium sp. 1.5R]|uniref:hypothetical protein n=1 Tax=Microbacterium sp. 1.5R TaxID=1916917 RepID=UPI0011A617C0|nr:hypothetical protein [Microbacterium sp. 1.5R]